MSGKFRVDRLDGVLASINELVKKQVLVGVPDSAPDRKEGPLSNAQIGYILEHGSPANNLPPRPHLLPGVQDARPKVEPELQAGVTAALDGDAQMVDTRLNRAGIVAASAVKAKINSNVQPALSERTLADRRRRGVTRENTLVDTAQYRNSITHVVRKKG
ncbi:hypothetical protein RA224_21670 [Achromobacter aegrifaciens]|uniref:hypothetical protein n=1 Tax=Achromobacter aegrifaciens TaxID=1287736 RepID=UPI0027BAEAB1|nr:hypothetical protein [Achromobacter aegrifaciens]WLW59828.1 hypothetical protein RA224_21670 [Achromobacter aegrifaciens]